MEGMHENLNRGGKEEIDFLDYPEQERFELEREIRKRLYDTHQSLTPEQQVFYNANKEMFSPSDDQPYPKRRT